VLELGIDMQSSGTDRRAELKEHRATIDLVIRTARRD